MRNEERFYEATLTMDEFMTDLGYLQNEMGAETASLVIAHSEVEDLYLATADGSIPLGTIRYLSDQKRITVSGGTLGYVVSIPDPEKLTRELIEERGPFGHLVTYTFFYPGFRVIVAVILPPLD